MSTAVHAHSIEKQSGTCKTTAMHKEHATLAFMQRLVPGSVALLRLLSSPRGRRRLEGGGRRGRGASAPALGGNAATAPGGALFDCVYARARPVCVSSVCVCVYVCLTYTHAHTS